MKFFIPLFIFAVSCFAQNNAKQEMLDSLNRARVSDKGAFNLYIKNIIYMIIIIFIIKHINRVLLVIIITEFCIFFIISVIIGE